MLKRIHKTVFFSVIGMSLSLTIAGCSRPNFLNKPLGAARLSEVTESKESSTLAVGSTAPPLTIEHWLSSSAGHFQPVNKFESGKIYVVEFWATWCPPCRASMPHLAELQQTYIDKLQIIGVSRESLAEVEYFLPTRPDPASPTYAEITAGYCLTVDPDGSTYRDYMDASKSTSLPKAFVIGADGKIRWIGHPMNLGEVLPGLLAETP